MLILTLKVEFSAEFPQGEDILQDLLAMDRHQERINPWIKVGVPEHITKIPVHPRMFIMFYFPCVQFVMDWLESSNPAHVPDMRVREVLQFQDMFHYNDLPGKFYRVGTVGTGHIEVCTYVR